MFPFCNLQTTVVTIMIIEQGVYIYLALLLTVNTEKSSGWYFYIIAVIGTTGDCPMTCFAFAFHWHPVAIQACPAMADACSPVRGDRRALGSGLGQSPLLHVSFGVNSRHLLLGLC